MPGLRERRRPNRILDTRTNHSHGHVEDLKGFARLHYRVRRQALEEHVLSTDAMTTVTASLFIRPGRCRPGGEVEYFEHMRYGRRHWR